MLRAGALLYAIFIAFIISVICASLSCIYIFLDQQVSSIDLEDEFEATNEIGLNEFLNGNEFFQKLSILTPNSDEINLSIKPWGGFNVLKISSNHLSQTRVKSYLVGRRREAEHKYALYLTGQNDLLGIVGKPEIIGDCYIPKAKLKKGIDNGFKYTTDGISIQKSEASVIESIFNTQRSIFDFDSGSTSEKVVVLSENETFDFSFDSLVTIISLPPNTVLNNISISGYCKIKCNGSLTINANCSLKDIIIEARKVILKNGLTATFQIIATDSIIVEKGVNIKYPSCFILAHDKQSVSSGIYLYSGCNYFGDLIVIGTNSKDDQIFIDENVGIFGQIVCGGNVELKSQLKGSIMTEMFLFKSPVTNFPNLLINPQISIEELPGYYCGSVFSPYSINSIIKELK